MKTETEQKVDIDYADQRQYRQEGQEGICDHVYDHAGIYLLLREHVGRSAAGSRTGFLGIFKISGCSVAQSLVCTPDFLVMSERRQVLSMDLLAQKSLRRERFLSFLCNDQFYTDRLVRCWYRHVCDSGSRRIIR